MPGEFQVTAIVKRGGHYNPHERIQALGNNAGGWMLSEDATISRIEAGAEKFYAIVNGRKVYVEVAVHGVRKYLKTTADAYAPNNLLDLPDCINCKMIA